MLGRLYGPCTKLGQLLPTTVYMAQKFCCREGKASLILKFSLSVNNAVQFGNTIAVLKAVEEVKQLSYAHMLIH